MGNILITTKFYQFPLVKLISLNSGSLSKILHRLNTQIKLILVGNHTKYLTPLTGEDPLEAFEDQGYTIACNPSRDGDCQFSALFLPLKDCVYRSANIHREIVQYLSESPNNSERQPLEYFFGLPWPRYLHNMTQSGMYDDHITL